MRRRPPETPTIEGIDIPPELADRDHVVWHDEQAWRGFCKARGWRLDMATRLRDYLEEQREAKREGAIISPDPDEEEIPPPSPFARRRHAIQEFANDHDVGVADLDDAGITP